MMVLCRVVVAAVIASSSPPAAPIPIRVGATVVATRSQFLGGLGIEEANHQLYGGLWSQMVFGDSFEEPGGAHLA